MIPIDNIIYVLSNNPSRIQVIRQNLYSLDPSNIQALTFDQLLDISSFSRNVIIVADNLNHSEAQQINEHLTNIADTEQLQIIDLHNNFVGLNIYNKVICLPELSAEHADKITERAWEDLRATSDIYKLALFKSHEIKTRTYDQVDFQKTTEQLDDLQGRLLVYEEAISNLKNLLQQAQADLDKKIEETTNKDEQIKELERKVEILTTQLQQQKTDLEERLQQHEIREREYKRIINQVGKEYDIIGFVQGHEVESRKNRLIREAREQGKTVIGVVGKGKSFIKKSIAEGDDFVVVNEPNQADYWVIVTTPDTDAVREFKKLILSKPINRSLKIITLWNNSYPFTAESLVESDVDLLIPYDGEYHKRDWLQEEQYPPWKTELNNLVRSLQRK